jgi:hypothetical protein
LILYLIVATALLLASRVRAATFELGEAGATVPAMRLSRDRRSCETPRAHYEDSNAQRIEESSPPWLELADVRIPNK